MTAKTFEVETGGSSETSNSYASIANADEYNDTYLSNSTWTGLSDANKELYLMRATQWLDKRYNKRWYGERANEDQALDWPRASITDTDGYNIDSDEIPQCIIDSCCEAAVIIAGGEDMMPDQSDSGTVKRTKKKVGPILTETEYMGGNDPQKRYTTIDALLRQVVRAPGEIIRG